MTTKTDRLAEATGGFLYQDSRAEKRREKKVRDKVKSVGKVRIPIPEEFLDVMDEPWQTRESDGTIRDLDFQGVLVRTIRRAPVKTGEDAEKTLDILSAIKGADNGYIEFTQNEFDWFLSHVKNTAFAIWLAPDAAFLAKYLKEVAVKPEDVEAIEESGSEDGTDE
jgi:hypothetical protein